MLVSILVEWICFSGKDILYAFAELFTYYAFHGSFEGIEDKHDNYKKIKRYRFCRRIW